jgi:hypothetical protein
MARGEGGGPDTVQMRQRRGAAINRLRDLMGDQRFFSMGLPPQFQQFRQPQQYRSSAPASVKRPSSLAQQYAPNNLLRRRRRTLADTGGY